jgi:alkylation response protein AidB-like acyl-CoA dehydrogenase
VGSGVSVPTPGSALEAARWASVRFAERAADADESGEFAEKDLVDLRSSGLLALMVPARLGGMGASFGDYVDVAMELAAGSGATALVYNMHASVTGALALMPDDLVRAIGADESFFSARDAFLEAARDGALYAVAMSERNAGARLSAVESTYQATAHGFRIRAEKTFVSGAGYADAYLVAARSSSDASRVSLFLVPNGPGISIVPTWDALGMRASASHDLSIDLEVGRESLLGSVEGLALVVARLMPQWLVASYAAVYVGVAQAALAEARRHIERRGLGKLASVRSRVGRADASIAAARLAVREAAKWVDAAPGERVTNQSVYRAKLLAGDVAAWTTSSLLEACGASALRRGHPLERLYRDARCGALQPASSDLCADWLGTAVLGGDPDSGSEMPRW